jgi:hypothetical protein
VWETSSKLSMTPSKDPVASLNRDHSGEPPRPRFIAAVCLPGDGTGRARQLQMSGTRAKWLYPLNMALSR